MKIKLNKILKLISICALGVFNTLNAEMLNIVDEIDLKERELVLSFKTTNATENVSLSSAMVGDVSVGDAENIKYSPFSTYGYSNYIFLVDASKNNTTFYWSRDKSLKNFSDNIKYLMNTAQDRQRFGLYDYSSLVRHIVSLPSNPVRINNALFSLKTSSSTSAVLFQAIDFSINQFKNNDVDTRNAIVVFGTGRSTDVSCTIEKSIAKAKENNVMIFTVGKAESEEERQFLQRFQKLSDETAAKAFPELNYNNLLDDIYSITQSGGKFNIKLPKNIDESKKLVLNILVEEEGIDAYTKTIEIDISKLKVIEDIPSEGVPNEDLPSQDAPSEDISLEGLDTLIKDLESVLAISNQIDLDEYLNGAKAVFETIKSDFENINEGMSAADISKFVETFEKNLILISEKSQAVNNVYSDSQKTIKSFEVKIEKLEAFVSLDSDKEKLAKAKEILLKIKDNSANIKTNIVLKIDEYKDLALELFSSNHSKLFKGIDLISLKLEESTKILASIDSFKAKCADDIASINSDSSKEEVEALEAEINTAKSKAELNLIKIVENLALIEESKAQVEANLATLIEQAQSDVDKSEIEKQQKALKNIEAEITALNSSLNVVSLNDFDELLTSLNALKAELGLGSASSFQLDQKDIIIISVAAGLIGLLILLIIILIIVKSKKRKRARMNLEMEEAQAREAEAQALKEAEAQAEALREAEALKEAELLAEKLQEEERLKQEALNQKTYAVIRIMGAKNEFYPLTKEFVRVGRGENNDIVIENDSVSRYHVELKLKGSEYLIIDLGTSNGTFVNSQRMVQATLKSGDIIELGTEVKMEIKY